MRAEYADNGRRMVLLDRRLQVDWLSFGFAMCYGYLVYERGILYLS